MTFFFFFMSGGSKSDFPGASISLRLLLTVLRKIQFFGPSREVPFEAFSFFFPPFFVLFSSFFFFFFFLLFSCFFFIFFSSSCSRCSMEMWCPDDIGRIAGIGLGRLLRREHASTPQSGVEAPRLLKRSLPRLYCCCFGAVRKMPRKA